MKYFRKILSVFLLATMLLGMMTSVAVPTTYADSNDRVSTFLKMAAGAEITNEDVSGLSMDQLQFLGVYLSNFYQPFGTEFGGSNDEIAENCRTDMIKAMQTKLAFSEEMSAVLVDSILQMTRQSNQYLDIYASVYNKTTGNEDFVKMPTIYANYYNFLRMMVGNSDFVTKRSIPKVSCDQGPIGNVGKGVYKKNGYSDGYSALRALLDINHGGYDTGVPEGNSEKYLPACSYYVYTPDAQKSGSYKFSWEKTSAGSHYNRVGDIFTTLDYISVPNWNNYSTEADSKTDYWSKATAPKILNIVDSGMSEHKISALLGGQTAYADIITDWEYWLQTFYVYQALGGSYKIVSPFVNKDGARPYKLKNEGGYPHTFSISFMQDVVFNRTTKSVIKQTGYWCVSKSSSSGGISLSPVEFKDGGRDVSDKILTFTLEVDKKKWKECEDLLIMLSIEQSAIDGVDPTYFFGYEKDGEVKIVSDCTSTYGLKSGVNYTPSQLQFMKCLETVDMRRGYGINLFDFNRADTGKDKEWDDSAFIALCNRLGDTDSLYANKEISLKATMWGQRISVDCFGNLLAMGANHQYIIVPSCMNPYTWRAVDKNGEDIIGAEGAFLNIINAKNLVQVDKGAIGEVYSTGSYVLTGGYDTIKSYDSSNIKHLTAEIDHYAESSDGYSGIALVFSSNELRVKDKDDHFVIPARLIRGQGDYIVKENSWWPWSETDIAKQCISNIINVFVELHPEDKTAYHVEDEDNRAWGYWSDEFIPMIDLPGRIATSSKSDCWLLTRNKVNIMDGYVFIDNLGVYKNEDGSDSEYHAFNVEHYIDTETGTPAGKIAGGIVLESDFGSHAQMIISGKTNNLESCSSQALSSIYVSYVYSYFYTDENKADTIGKIGYRFFKEALPDAPTELVDIEFSDVVVDVQLNSIRDWSYYLLHPTKGYDYVTTLITNKLNHLLLGWHAGMVGTNGVGITAGTTKYRSNVGYVTMPDLSEIRWTDKLISFYQECIPFLIILIVVLMLFAFITGTLSLQRSILASILFAAFLLLPVSLINGSVQFSNAFSQRIYGEKFSYWAMVQQETYSKQIDEAANSTGSSGESSYSNYLRTLYGLNEQVYSNQGGESILLKWQAPKKMASLVLSEADGKSLTGLDAVGLSMLNGMLGRSFGGQSYVDDAEAVYMYRSYIDISNFSRYIYDGISIGTVPSNKNANDISSIMSGAFSDSLRSSVRNLGTTYQSYRSSGYTSWGIGESSSFPNYDYILLPLSSAIVADAVRNSSGLANFSSKNNMIAINQDIFNFGLPMFTNSTMEFSIENFAATGGFTSESPRYTALEDYMRSYSSSPQAFVGLASYALYSENPFYYYSWKLYHDGLNHESSLINDNGYKTLLLSQPDGGYFYYNSGNGGLKDFMDMKSLFTYIIPYMRECNDLVREWDDVYGIFIYDGVPTEEGHWSDVEGDAELTAKYWHNLNVSRLYCLYCPWVDIMYDCSYADPEIINVMGKKVTIEDPLNPASYPSNRPMIFSEAEMKDYGITESDLTRVEQLILKCNEDMQERMYELLNYYNFSDITLNTAAAMQCAFAFNITFSESGIMSDNHNIYPQSYDLSNFSYDAFLRFILAESTGESLLDTSKTHDTYAGDTSGDFYERVVNNSSTTTALVILILDILAIYVVPAFKMFFLIAIFISSILIVFVSLCQIEDNAKFIRKVTSGFLLPLLKFFIITIAFSWVVSLFMGKGNNSITQTDELAISMGDPVVVVLIMIALNLLIVILYWKIIKSAIMDIKRNGKMAINFAGGVIGAVGGMVAGSLMSKSNSIEGKSNPGSGSGTGRSPEKAQEGTGVESDRAAQRGSGNVEDKKDESPTHGNDPRKKSTNASDVSDENSEEKREKIDKAAKTGAENITKDKKSNKGDSGKDDKKSEPKKQPAKTKKSDKDTK